MNTHATHCVFRHLSEMRMKGLRLTEKSVEIAMWFPSILKHALITQEKWISDFYTFIKKNKIHRKSFGQIGVKYLLPDDDFNLFSHNNFLGERVFSGGKTDTLTRLPKSRQNVYEELFLLDSSTSKLLAPAFSYTAPQTSKWPLSFYNPTEWHSRKVQWRRLKCRVRWQHNPWGMSCGSLQIRISLKISTR